MRQATSGSYWLDRARRPASEASPLPEDVACVVVGGGIAGVAVARALASEGQDVCLIERDALGLGASGRNAGFVLADPAHCFSAVAADHGRARAVALRDVGLTTRRLIEEVAARHDIGWRQTGSLRLTRDDRELAYFQASAKACGLEYFARDALPAQWQHDWIGGLIDPGDGVVDPLALLDALWRDADDAGARCCAGVEVRSTERERQRWLVRTSHGDVRCDALVLCASAHTDTLLPSEAPPLGVRPARAQMMAASVKPAPAWPMPIYARWGHDYARMVPGGTLLVGGCRDVDVAGETTDDAHASARIQASLDELARALVGSDVHIDVVSRWAGIMALTDDEQPRVGPVTGCERLYTLTALQGHGMGWALGYADDLVRRIVGDA